ncbi:MAG: hypothetical protein ACYDD6_04100 [Acidimicrobiales bacterium]
MTRRLLGMAILLTALSVGWALTADVAAASSNWSVGLGASGTGEAVSMGVPGAPAGVSASCSGVLISPTASVTWSSVSHATSYSTYESTTSSSSGFNLVASGVTLLAWTSPTLSTGSYWFAVAAYIGTNWASGLSSPTSQISVLLGVSCT